MPLEGGIQFGGVIDIVSPDLEGRYAVNLSIIDSTFGIVSPH